MANNLRCSAAEESEDTLNALTSLTRCEVCYRGADPHTPFCIRAIQGHCTEPQGIRLFLRLVHIPIGLTAYVCHVEYPGNKYSIEIDGLLAGGRGLRIGWQFCCFSELRPFATMNHGPVENSATPRFFYFHEDHRHVLVYLFELVCSERRQNIVSGTELKHARMRFVKDGDFF